MHLVLNGPFRSTGDKTSAMNWSDMARGAGLEEARWWGNWLRLEQQPLTRTSAAMACPQNSSEMCSRKAKQHLSSGGHCSRTSSLRSGMHSLKPSMSVNPSAPSNMLAHWWHFSPKQTSNYSNFRFDILPRQITNWLSFVIFFVKRIWCKVAVYACFWSKIKKVWLRNKIQFTTGLISWVIWLTWTFKLCDKRDFCDCRKNIWRWRIYSPRRAHNPRSSASITMD